MALLSKLMNAISFKYLFGWRGAAGGVVMDIVALGERGGDISRERVGCCLNRRRASRHLYRDAAASGWARAAPRPQICET
jgi:hypothetical protein